MIPHWPGVHADDALGAACDELNAQIARVSTLMQAAGLHAAADVLLENGWRLMWGKLDGKWQLHLYSSTVKQELSTASIRLLADALEREV